MTAAGGVPAPPSERDWAAAVDLLTGDGRPPTVVLACHVSPDGDALGSMLALGVTLRRRGVPVCCSWGSDPVEAPPTYRYLPGLDLLTEPAALPPRPDVLVTLDTGSTDRLGLLEPLVGRAGAVLVIDHHASNTLFGTHHLVDVSAAATAVLVAELIDRLGEPFDADIAAGVYTGLTTDTGSFRFAGTTPGVHALAGRLLATGIRHDLIARAIWDTNRLGYLRVLGAALDRLAHEPDAAGGLGLVWTWTTPADLARHGVRLEEIEGIIDVIRTAEEAEVAVVCKGDADGSFKVSTRSKGRVDMGAICVAEGGGGHRFAAGFTSYDDAETTVRRLRDRLAGAPHLPV